MPLSLLKKKEIVDELHGRFKEARIFVLTEYKGLDVASINSLRRNLRNIGAEYRVVKNTMLEKASESTGAEVIRSSFKGPSAIAFSSNDPVAFAKVLTEFAKGNDKLKIKAGALKGRAIDPKGVSDLANLPPREILLSQLLSAMNGVSSSFVRVLSGVPRKFLYVLQAVREKKEAA